MAQQTFVSTDIIDLVYNLLKEDSELKAIQGLSIQKISDRRALASTTGQGNQRVMIRKSRCGPASWTSGGAILHEIEYVTIETVCKATAGAETDARTLANAIRLRIKRLMFEATFYGTGWLWHREIDDQYPSPPLKTHAVHVLAYEMHTTSGFKS